EAIAPHDVHLLLGLVEDWARGISNRSPLPTGAQDAVAISHWLLDHFDDTYSADDEVRRTLAVIAKFPLGDRERFLALAGEKEEGRRTPAAVRPTRRAR